MAKYRNPAEKLLREDEDRKLRLAELGEAWDELVVCAHLYGAAWKVATDNGWQVKQLSGAGFAQPASLRLPEASADLLAERRPPVEEVKHSEFG